MPPTLLSLLLLILSQLCTTTLVAQSPVQSPAAAPAKSPKHKGPTDTLTILLKAGNFTSFARLIKATHVDTQLYSQLNSSTFGITMFAPSEIAFSTLKSGRSLDSLSPLEKLEFVQYHVLPIFLLISDFQTLSNPVKTLAGATSKVALTITTSDNTINIDTGVVKTSVVGTVYTDKEVAIYQVDKLLLPKDLFPPVAAPAPAKVNAESPHNVVPKDASGAIRFHEFGLVLFGVSMLIALIGF